MTNVEVVTIILSAAALFLSLVSIIWRGTDFFLARSQSKYDTLDKALSEVIRDTMLYPHHRWQDWIDKQAAKTQVDDEMLAYEAHAALCLNTVETAVSKYGAKVMETHFGSAMRMLLTRHKAFYEKNKAGYEALAQFY